MRLMINLATRHYIDKRRLNLFLIVAFFLIFLWLLFNVKTIAGDLGESSKISTEINSLEMKSAGSGKPVSEQEYQAMLKKINMANGVIEKKAFNWLTLLDMLEGVVPDGVALISVEPDPKSGSLKVTGSALAFANIRKLLEAMESTKYFHEVLLDSQSEAKVDKTQKGINFSVSCKVALK